MLEAAFQQAYPFALRAAEVRARTAVASGEVSWGDGDDFVQEGLLACWRSLPFYDPNRASLRTYIEVVTSSRLASMHRARRCRPRSQALEDERVVAGDGWARRIELRVDVRRVLATLDDGDRRVAWALTEDTPTEVSRQMGVARSSVYRSIWRIRMAFEGAGLGPRRYGGGDRLRRPGEEA